MQTAIFTTLALAALATAAPAVEKRDAPKIKVALKEATVNKGVMINCVNELTTYGHMQWMGPTQCKTGNFHYELWTNGAYNSPADCYNNCAPLIGDAINNQNAVSVACTHSAGGNTAQCALNIWVDGSSEPSTA